MVEENKKDKELWKKFQGYGKIKRHKLAELIINHHLSNGLFGFFMKLLTMAHHRTGTVSTCLRELLCISGACRKTLQKDLKILSDKGLIKYKTPKARWKENVSYSVGEAPYLIEIFDYLQYFEGTSELSTQVMPITSEEFTQVKGSTRENNGQVLPSTGVISSNSSDVNYSNTKDNNQPNKHDNKQYNDHHQSEINNTSVITTQVNDDVLWIQEEFSKRTDNHGTKPFVDRDTCLFLLNKYGKEKIGLHLLRLDLRKADNPPGLLISSLENPERYGCLRVISQEEKKDEEKRKETIKKKKEEEKKKQEENAKQEYEKKKELWNTLDNTTRKRYIDRMREIIIEENKGVSQDILRLNLLDLNVFTRAMQLYFSDKEKDLCRA